MTDMVSQLLEGLDEIRALDPAALAAEVAGDPVEQARLRELAIETLTKIEELQKVVRRHHLRVVDE